MTSSLRWILAGALCAVAGPAVAQNLAAPQPAAAQPAVADNAAAYLGAASCTQCHRSDSKVFEDRLDFILRNESDTWLKHDPHSRAYEVLSSPTSVAMEQVLGWSAGQAKTEAACLACHANPEVKSDPAKLAEGVGCELCHGPGKNWLAPHLDPKFRTAGTEEWAKVGFKDVMHSTGRAALCSGCHIGDETRRVTHDMYAAGHPPLPAFELSLYMTRIPNHWKPLREMPETVRKGRGFEENPIVALQDAAAGSLIALERTTKAFTGSEPGMRIVAGFEAYDCYSCHHELRNTDSLRRAGVGVPGEDFFDWRLAADPSLPPGRLRVPQWPYEIPELLSIATKQKSELKPVRVAFMSQIGAGQVQKDMAPVTWAESTRKELFEGSFKFDAAAADAYLAAAIDRGIREPMSFDSARLVAGAIRAVVRDRQPGLDANSPAGMAIKALEDELNLNVDWPERAADPAAEEGPIVARLPALAEKRTEYRPKVVREALKALQQALQLGERGA